MLYVNYKGLRYFSSCLMNAFVQHWHTCMFWFGNNQYLFTECGAQNTEQAGVILSPGYPVAYPANVTCDYTISSQQGSVVIITFNHLDLDYNKDTISCNDYVEVGYI